MDVRFVYDIPYVKEVLGFLVIPFLIFIIVCTTFLMIYAYKHKNHEDVHYKYKISLYTLIISTLLVAALFAVLVGFALSFKKQADAAGIKNFVVYVVLASPLLPLFSLLALLAKTIKLIKDRPNGKYEEQKEIPSVPVQAEDKEESISITEINTPITEPEQPAEEIIAIEELEEENQPTIIEQQPEPTNDEIVEVKIEDLETLEEEDKVTKTQEEESSKVDIELL